MSAEEQDDASISYGFKDITGTDWWLHQIATLANWRPGGVFVVFTGPKACIAPAASWLYTATGLMTGAGKGERLFSKILLVVPACSERHDYKRRLRETFETSSAESGNEIPSTVRELLDSSESPLVSTDCDQILRAVEQLPAGSAIGICGAQRLRFYSLNVRTGPAATTYTGYQVHHSSGEDLMHPHLHEMIRRLLNLATGRSLSVIVFVEDFDFEMRALPEDLRTNAELAVVSMRYEETERSHFQIANEALRISRAQGFESALGYIHKNLPDGLRQAHTIGFIYADQGLWTEAWKTLKPHANELREMNDTRVLLNLAQTAVGCGEAEEAGDFLQQAFHLGFDTVEAFNSAALIAKTIGSVPLLDQILREMSITYPLHPFTFARSYGRLISTGRHGEAADMARAVGAPFEAAWAALHEQTPPDWEAFITVGRQANREHDALAKCVAHALDLGQLKQARELFNRIPENDATADVRAELLFEMAVKEVGFVERDSDLDRPRKEFSHVFASIALNPQNRDLRTRVTHWFETLADEMSRMVILFACCQDAFVRAASSFGATNASGEDDPLEIGDVEESVDEAKAFMTAVAEHSRDRALGHAIIPPAYASGVSDKIMSGLGVLVFAFSKEPDLHGIANTLQCINLACRIRKESTWDFEAAIQLISALASQGKSSDALNLAETILIFLSDNKNTVDPARLAHCWSCVAEAYQRSRHPLNSLLYAILFLEAMAARPARQHATLLKHKLRLLTRVLRDLNLGPYASTFLTQEKKLIDAFPTRANEENEWLVTVLSCRLNEIDATTPESEIREMVEAAQRLLENESEREWEPSVSAVISLVRILEHAGIEPPKLLLELVQRRLPECSPSSQKLFRRALLNHPNRADVEAAVKDLTEGNVYDDQGYRFTIVEGVLRRALNTACRVSDPELFVLAASWLSQPALAASRSTRELIGQRPEAQLIPFPELLSSGAQFNTEQLRDYGVAMQRQMSRTRSNFEHLTILPASAARYVAAPDEALCLAAHDSFGNLCRLIVKRDDLKGPAQLAGTDWNYGLFTEWTKKYPRAYSWDRNYSALGSYDTPDVDDIRSSLSSLQPRLPTDVSTLTILPEADLFGFTFFLTETSGHWIGERTCCVTAPSLTWLATVRRLPPPVLDLKAWLGHPTGADDAVLRPRGELKPIIESAGGTLLDSETPRGVGNAGVAVILSHGSEGTFGGFAGVNDVGQFTNEDLSGWLGDSACVVLFVCNAGRNDRRIFNQETFGLIGQLLRRGVRAVVAPPAPLRNNLPAIWFAPFIQALGQGKTVGRAYSDASQKVREVFNHPCAWGALQLFGDAQLSFIPTSVEHRS